MAAIFYSGKRLSYDGQLCTVRYSGPVHGTKGEWLGVEWDDPTRGKHSGEHQGTRYFTCINPSPTSASFIRPTRSCDPPRSFVEALKFKYASDPIPEDYEDPDVHIVYVGQPMQGGQMKTTAVAPARNASSNPIKISGKIAEEVGFDKIRKKLAQLEELRIIILDGLCMCRPDARGEQWMQSGPMTDVSKTCPKVTELDLSRNLFEEWREIAAVCEQLERLKSLRVE